MDKNKISKHWGNNSPEEAAHIFNFEPIIKYFYETITKESYSDNSDINKWTVNKYLKNKIPVKNLLSLGCGHGFLERKLAELNVYENCLGIDISEGAIEKARFHAKQKKTKNLKYEITDVDFISIEKEKYDVIWVNGALHHIRNLEHLIFEIYKGLKKEGILIANEFIGPNYQKLSKSNREIINSVIHLIPKELRYFSEETYTPPYFRNPIWKRIVYEIYKILFFKQGVLDIESFQTKPKLTRTQQKLYNLYLNIKKLQTGKNKKFKYGKVWDYNPYFYKVIDPSECIRSADIVNILKSKFKKIDVLYYNGSIVNYCIDPKFIKNFDPQNKKHQNILDLIINIEKTLINIGELEPHFAHIICVKN